MGYLPLANESVKRAPIETIALPNSTFLQAASYDPSTFSLTIDFKNGSQVVHRFVFPMVWQQFKESRQSQFYARNVKGKYPSVSFRQPLKVSDFTRAKKRRAS